MPWPTDQEWWGKPHPTDYPKKSTLICEFILVFIRVNSWFHFLWQMVDFSGLLLICGGILTTYVWLYSRYVNYYYYGL